MIESWFHAPDLDGLQELDISFEPLESNLERYPFPPSVLRLAATLHSASIGICVFPKEVAPSFNFPILKQLTLWNISISEDVFHELLSSCPVLEVLNPGRIHDVDCLRITSRTLKIIAIIHR